jgi:DNA-binding MarR family transcriptional regulator
VSNANEIDVAALADRLHSAAIHLLRGVRREDAAAGVPPAQLSALSVLVFGGPTTLARLAEAEQVRPPTMSRIVAALEVAGLVERSPHPSDARSALLSPTAAGRAMLVAGRRRRVGVLEARLRALPARDLANLARAADVLARVSRG